MAFYILEINKNLKGDMVINSRVKSSPRDKEAIINLLNNIKDQVNVIIKETLVDRKKGNNGN